jgi:hypothetical protein
MPFELGRYGGLAMSREIGGGGHGYDRSLRDLAGNQTGVGQFAIVDADIDALLHKVHQAIRDHQFDSDIRIAASWWASLTPSIAMEQWMPTRC